MLDLLLQGGCFLTIFLDHGEGELVLEVGFPELLVVVDVGLELRVHQFLNRAWLTPWELVA